MQSHQNSFGMKAANAKINHKLSGHRRMPTIGKTMAVTDLLLSSSPQTLSAIHSRQACDGSDRDQHQFNQKHSSTFPKYDSDDKEPNDDGNKNCEKDGNIIDNSALQKPCLICTGTAPVDLVALPLAINEMCGILCNENCRLGLSLTGHIPTISDLSAQIALTELVKQPAIFPQLNLMKQNDSQVFATLPSGNENQQGQMSSASLSSSSELSTNVAMMRQKFLTDMLNEQNADTLNSECCSSPAQYAADSHKASNTMSEDFREKCEIAEALAKTSAMTSTTQIKQRLAARKLKIELSNQNAITANVVGGCDHQDALSSSSSSLCSSPDCLATQNGNEYEPPRERLLHIVRMGSFNSAPKILNIDSQDDGLQIPKGLNTNDLLQHVKQLRGDQQPPLLSRCFLKPVDANVLSSDITDSLRYLKLASVPRVYTPQTSAPNHIRLLQWNILSQTLGQNNDGFVRCPEQALTWENRKFLIIQEILQTNPDIICLQEVDHFKFLQNILGTQNYEGIFYPKPDSPCLYIEENNGPDGCAVFYKRDKFELKNFDTRILEVWRVQSNQVAIATNLRIKGTDTEICVCTTHLKARHGSLLSKLRNEQGRDLLRFVKQFAEERPLILCGDFNAEPTEPIYSTILNYDILNLSSAYADVKDEVEKCNQNGDKPIEECDKISSSIKREPSYTTWKIRENGEECHTIDYVFYSKDVLKVKNCLEFPQDDEIGKNRTPSFQYPSDHFSLVCDFEILNLEQQAQQEK